MKAKLFLKSLFANFTYEDIDADRIAKLKSFGLSDGSYLYVQPKQERYSQSFKKGDLEKIFQEPSLVFLQLKGSYYIRGYLCSTFFEEAFAELIQQLQTCNIDLQGLDLNGADFKRGQIMQVLEAILQNDHLRNNLKSIGLRNTAMDTDLLLFINNTFANECPNLMHVGLGGQAAGAVDSGRGPAPDSNKDIEKIGVNRDIIAAIQEKCSSRSINQASSTSSTEDINSRYTF